MAILNGGTKASSGNFLSSWLSRVFRKNEEEGEEEETPPADPLCLDPCCNSYPMRRRRQGSGASNGSTNWRRGRFLIINVASVVGRSLRDGARMDEELLARTWARLGFEVRVGLSPVTQSRDLTSREILHVLAQMALDEELELDDAFGCAVLSHASDEESLLGSDGFPVTVSQIVSMFAGERCKGLKGKPKMFFFQLSHSKKIMAELLPAQELPTPSKPSDVAFTRFPVCDDAVIYRAVVNATPALKFEQTGSWFVRALTETLQECGEKDDFLTLLTRVNKKILSKEWTILPVHKEWTPVNKSSSIRLPVTVTHLSRDLYLNPAAIAPCRLTLAAPTPNQDIVDALLESPRQRRKALKLYSFKNDF